MPCGSSVHGQEASQLLPFLFLQISIVKQLTNPCSKLMMVPSRLSTLKYHDLIPFYLAGSAVRRQTAGTPHAASGRAAVSRW